MKAKKVIYEISTREKVDFGFWRFDIVRMDGPSGLDIPFDEIRLAPYQLKLIS